MSAPYFNKKCDEFGAVFDEVLRQEKASDENCMQVYLSKVLKETEKNPVTPAGKSGNSEEDTSVIDPIVVELMAQIVQSVSSEVERKTFKECKLPLLPGCKYVIDNFDIFQRVRSIMTEENQNKDIHWVNHNRIPNRISGSHLPDNGPIFNITELENAKLVPSSIEHIIQRSNYIVLVERILVACIPYLKFCEDIVNKHIPHKHSAEAGMKSSKVWYLHTVPQTAQNLALTRGKLSDGLKESILCGYVSLLLLRFQLCEFTCGYCQMHFTSNILKAPPFDRVGMDSSRQGSR